MAIQGREERALAAALFDAGEVYRNSKQEDWDKFQLRRAIEVARSGGVGEKEITDILGAFGIHLSKNTPTKVAVKSR